MGSIIEPPFIGFQAAKNTSQTISSTAKVTFEEDSSDPTFDEGDNYDTSTSIWSG